MKKLGLSSQGAPKISKDDLRQAILRDSGSAPFDVGIPLATNAGFSSHTQFPASKKDWSTLKDDLLDIPRTAANDPTRNANKAQYDQSTQ